MERFHVNALMKMANQIANDDIGYHILSSPFKGVFTISFYSDVLHVDEETGRETVQKMRLERSGFVSRMESLKNFAENLFDSFSLGNNIKTEWSLTEADLTMGGHRAGHRKIADINEEKNIIQELNKAFSVWIGLHEKEFN